MLAAENINQYYGGSHTLRGISLDVTRGQCLALLGRNGVGKTTLLKCLMGVLPVARGAVRLDGVDITRLAPHKRAALGMAYVPQGRDIFARLTVEENILMGMATKPAARARRIQGDIYELFPVLKSMLKRRGGDLSGGQQQQLAIGRALVTRPKLLVLDEPTEGIQPSIIKDIGRAITYLRGKGEMGIVLVEQYFEWARDLCDSYAVMDRGQVVLAGPRAGMVEADVLRWMSV